MKRNDVYMLAACELFKLIDVEVLDESFNGGDREYADDVINLLMMAHQQIYGDPAQPEEGEDTVIYPAMILDEENGRERLGLATCRIIPLPKETPIYELLKGRLLKAVAVRVPIEYQTLSHYSEEDPAEEREMTISVIADKNCIMKSCVVASREENEEDEDCTETEKEYAGEHLMQ